MSFEFPSFFVYFVHLGTWSLVWLSGEDEEGAMFARTQKIRRKENVNES